MHRAPIIFRASLNALAGLVLWGCGDAPLTNTPSLQAAPGHEAVVARRIVWPGTLGSEGLGADPRGSSPDGTVVPYVDWTTSDLWIRNLSTGESRQLTSKAPGEPYQYPGPAAISPDGTQVAYAWWNQDGVWDLRIVGLDRSNSRVVYSKREAQPYYSALDWSSDGSQILALLQKGDATNQIALISVETGAARVLRTLDWRAPSKMALSPDGRLVAYDFPPTPDSRQRDLYLLSSDGASHAALVTDPADDFVLGWVDGEHVLFASDRSGTRGAYIQRVKDGRADGAPQLVKPDLWRMVPGGATRNGSYYYTVDSRRTDIFTAALDPATGRVAAPTLIARDGLHPAWSRDGRYLAYVVEPASSTALVVRIRSLETGETRELFPRLNLGGDGSEHAGAVQWFPDGGALLVRARDLRSRTGLFRVDSQTGASSLLRDATDTTDTLVGYSPLLSPDGKTLFFTSGRIVPPFGFQTVALDLERRTERVVLSTIGAMAMAVSPDGQRLAFEGVDIGANITSGAGSPGLYTVPASGGEAVLLHRFEAELPWISPLHGEVEWSPDGRYVFFATTAFKTGGARLWRIPSSGGPAEPLDQLSDSYFDQFAMHMHPNGREVAFSAGTPGSIELWVMENLFAVTGNEPTRPSVVKGRAQ